MFLFAHTYRCTVVRIPIVVDVMYLTFILGKFSQYVKKYTIIKRNTPYLRRVVWYAYKLETVASLRTKIARENLLEWNATCGTMARRELCAVRLMSIIFRIKGGENSGYSYYTYASTTSHIIIVHRVCEFSKVERLIRAHI